MTVGTKLTRRVGAMAALSLLVLVLAACDTQPATNVSYQTATLNAKGACTAGTSGQWWFQLRDVSRGGGWYDATARVGYSCSQNTGEVNFQPQNVGGLNPGTTYHFRLATTVNGSFYWWDANGTKNGTAYDSFRTRDVGGREDQDAPPAEESAPCSPDSPDDACASSDVIRRKKNPLRNRFYWVFCEGCPFLEMDVSDHMSWINWSFNLTTKNIRSIFYKDSQARCLSNVGYCAVKYTRWAFGDCDRSGPDTCLFRNEAQVDVNFVVKGFAWTRQLFSCLGTRINWDGSHVRRAFEGQCSHTGTARAGASGDVSDQNLSVGGVPVGRYLTRADMDVLDRACISKTADRRECKRVALNLYGSLPDRIRGKVERRVSACPALSPRAVDRLAPGSRCARRS